MHFLDMPNSSCHCWLTVHIILEIDNKKKNNTILKPNRIDPVSCFHWLQRLSWKSICVHIVLILLFTSETRTCRGWVNVRRQTEIQYSKLPNNLFVLQERKCLRVPASTYMQNDNTTPTHTYSLARKWPLAVLLPVHLKMQNTQSWSNCTIYWLKIQLCIFNLHTWWIRRSFSNGM